MLDALFECRALGVSAEANRVLQIWARLEDPYASAAASAAEAAPAYRPPSTLAFSGRPAAAMLPHPAAPARSAAPVASLAPVAKAQVWAHGHVHR